VLCYLEQGGVVAQRRLQARLKLLQRQGGIERRHGLCCLGGEGEGEGGRVGGGEDWRDTSFEE
jgi:hypothetical protein